MAEGDGPKPQQVQITLHKDGVIAPTLRVVQETSEVVSFCLKAVQAGDLSTAPEFEASYFQLKLEGLDRTAELRKQHYTNWLLSKGFQDLARGVRETLEEAFFYNSVIELSRQEGGIRGAWTDMQETLQSYRNRAGTLNFPGLMDLVNKGLTARLHFDKEFLSLQRVRNCLEHRAGIVTEKDVDEGTSELRLSLPRVKVFFYEKDGQEIELQKNALVEKDTLIGFRNVIRDRSFKLGEQVTFKPEEFSEIGYGCWAFASDLGAKLADAAKPNQIENSDDAYKSTAIIRGLVGRRK